MEEIKDSEKYVLLKEELKIYTELFEKAYEKVLASAVTKFPIIVVHQEAIDIGIPVVNKAVNGGHWNIHISWMEEFISKKLIRPEKVDDFQALCNDRKDHYCLFVLSDMGAKFIFLPRVPIVR